MICPFKMLLFFVGIGIGYNIGTPSPLMGVGLLRDVNGCSFHWHPLFFYVFCNFEKIFNCLNPHIKYRSTLKKTLYIIIVFIYKL